MAKTLANLRDLTRMFLDEAVQADWTDTQVDQGVNAGYQEMVTAAMETYEDIYLTPTTINGIANQQEYGSTNGVPTNVFKVRRLEINYDTSTSSVYTKAQFARLDEITRDLAYQSSVSSFARPVYYFYGHGSDFKFGLLPYPTRSDTDAIKFWYVPYIADMTASTDTVNIPYPDRYAKAIGWYAAGSLLSKGQQEEVAGSKYLQQFEIEMAKFKRQLEDRASDNAAHVIDTESLDVDFTSYGAY